MSLLPRISWFKVSLLLIVVVLAGSVSCNRDQKVGVSILTELGNIEIEVYPDRAPVTALNFLALVEKGIYTNAFFYRVVRMDNQPHSKIKIEVIQGGLFDDNLVNQYAHVIHETTEVTGIKHTDGAISMARNEPGTASTEFFICIGAQPSLDFKGDRNPDGQGFAAFGKVTKGMDVIRSIQSLPDTGQYLQNHVIILEMQMIR